MPNEKTISVELTPEEFHVFWKIYHTAEKKGLLGKLKGVQKARWSLYNTMWDAESDNVMSDTFRAKYRALIKKYRF